ncbi:MAG: hypothetical protein L0Y57_00415 [Beijerinckiaceae bacterium]|nr:hypothetical protein [Beijerinckiaceae bacterium]
MTGNADATYRHATAVVIGEAGVLICGPSASGKSSLAYSLIAAAEGSGTFARLIGDDRVAIAIRNGRLIASGHPSILGKIERRGQGIFEVPFIARAVLRLAIYLLGPNEAPARVPPLDSDAILLSGIKLPVLRLPQEAAIPEQAHAILADLRLRRFLL